MHITSSRFYELGKYNKALDIKKNDMRVHFPCITSNLLNTVFFYYTLWPDALPLAGPENLQADHQLGRVLTTVPHPTPTPEVTVSMPLSQHSSGSFQ